MSDLFRKVTSRKFLLSAAAFMASVGVSLKAITVENEALAAMGIICSVLSAAIYAACEAYVDAAKKEEVIEHEDLG